MENKMPQKVGRVYGFAGMISLMFIIVALLTHDWFYLGVAYLMGGNLYRVINYQGVE